MIGLNLVVKNYYFIFTVYYVYVRSRMFESIKIVKISRFVELLLNFTERERKRERESSLYCRSANTLEINFPLPTEIISTISSLYPYWPSHNCSFMSDYLEIFNTQTDVFYHRDFRQGQGDIFFREENFFPITKLYLGLC